MQNTLKKTVIGVGGASIVALSGAALSSAQGGNGAAGSGASQQSSQTQQAQQAVPGGHGHGHGRGTPVDAATLTKIKSLVATKDSGVTVERAFKAPDGSFHAMGTKAGKHVRVELNAGLTTVSVHQGGPGGHLGRGEHGMRAGHHRGVEITGSTLTSVKNAVKAKYPAVSVEKAFKAPNGSFHAMGTKAGKRVMVHVSKDFKTVTVMAGGIGHEGHPGGHGPGDWRGAGAGQPGSGVPSSQASTPQSGSAAA